MGALPGRGKSVAMLLFRVSCQGELQCPNQLQQFILSIAQLSAGSSATQPIPNAQSLPAKLANGTVKGRFEPPIGQTMAQAK